MKAMKMITLYLPELYIEKLDEIIDWGYYPNRSEAIRVAVRDLIFSHFKFEKNNKFEKNSDSIE